MRRALIDYHRGAHHHRARAAAEAGARSDATCTPTAIGALEPHTAFASRFAPLLRVGDEDVLTFSAFATSVSRRAAGPCAARQTRVPRGHELSRHQGADVPAAVATSPRSTSCPNLDLIPNNTISLMKTNQRVHRIVPRRPQPRVRARAAVARVSRPTAAAAISASSGMCRLCRTRRQGREGSSPKI